MKGFSRILTVFVVFTLLLSMIACDMSSGSLIGKLLELSSANLLEELNSETIGVEDFTWVDTETDTEWWPQDTTEAEKETDFWENVSIPDVNYYGEEIVFLTREASEWSTVDIYSPELNSDPINDAVYRRNDVVQSMCGVVIHEIRTSNATDAVQRDVLGGGMEYNAIAQKLGESAILASKGYLQNLWNVPYLDLSQSWWDQNAIAGLSIQNRLYFATGDLLISDNDGTFALLFNKQIADECAIENIYELVNNGTWTFEAMYEMEKRVCKDLNGNGKMEYDQDIMGIAVNEYTGYCMMYTTGILIVDKDSDDIPEYVLDNQRTIDAISLSYLAIGDTLIAANMNTVNTKDSVENGVVCFGGGHALFMAECLQRVPRLRRCDVEFGILPFPKYNESQERYYSHMNEVGGVIAIPTTCRNLDATGIVLEAMAAYSTQTLTPAYYDIMLISMNVRDDESEPMLEMIMNNRIYDLGYVYDSSLSGYVNRIANKFMDGKTDVASVKPNSFIKQLQKLIKQFEDYDW